MQSHFLLRYTLCDFIILQDLYILVLFADLIKRHRFHLLAMCLFVQLLSRPLQGN